MILRSASLRRVDLYLDPEIDSIYPGLHAANVEVRLTNGATLTLTLTLFDANGTPADICIDDEVKEKFRRLALGVIREESIDDIPKIADDIEHLPSPTRLSPALRSTASNSEQNQHLGSGKASLNLSIATQVTRI